MNIVTLVWCMCCSLTSMLNWFWKCAYIHICSIQVQIEIQICAQHYSKWVCDPYLEYTAALSLLFVLKPTFIKHLCWTPCSSGFISSVRSSNSHPDLLVTQQQQHHPLFQIHTGPQYCTFTFWATTAISKAITGLICWLYVYLMGTTGRHCKIVQDSARWCKMVQDGARWCKMVEDGAR